MGRDMGKRCWRSFMLRMKKCAALLLTAILGLLISIPAAGVKADVAGLEINDTNFKDPWFQKYMRDKVDSDRDGYLSPSEIEKIKSIQFLSTIKGLSGIEYLTSLEELEVRGCNLGSLDLSSNKALKKVICVGCSLTSLTLGTLPALTEINCYHNKLTSLDVTGCPNLTLLKCSSNQIESLNLSKCTALTLLNCYDNSLVSLDVSVCTALKNLYCGENSLTELDLKNNKALKELECQSNQINTLDLRKNTALTEVDCSKNQLETLLFNKNTKMTTLLCHINKLSEINVSAMKSLKVLNFYNNRIKILDVSSNPKLESLDCSYNPLTELDVTSNPALKELDFSNLGLRSIDLSKNTALEKLECYLNRLTSLDLSKNTELTTLSCWHNKLTVLDIHLCPKLVNLVDNCERGTGNSYAHDYYYYSTGSQYFAFDTDITLITSVPSVGKVTNLSAASAGKNKVKLIWDAVEGAEGYLVYAQKDGKYGYVGMTTQETTFTDSQALDTDYNYYWVFAYAKDIAGFMHPGACEKYVYAKGVTLAVTNLKASSVKGGVKLSWTASSQAEGYLVYGIRPGGSYGYIGMTTQGTTFTDTKASKTDYTFYWVFPYHKDAGGNMIVGGTAKYTYGRAK